MTGVELWAGVECTRNRVRDDFLDQLHFNGHVARLDDLDLFAELGIKAIRYPILWEHVAPTGLDDADWRWADERLGRLQEIGIRPIFGLIHHGSGPRHTSLIDPQFPEHLATFARAVAERYPWLSAYTPVNEPLTTARFSGLYGHWYPHGRNERTFVRAFLNQCRAVALSMAVIRERNPNAQLIQTEDLGKTSSTPKLAYQAEVENERRWLSFDLLCGRINHHHSLWGYLIHAGASEAELEWFQEHACPPNILGINHYLSSERFLDERMERYPIWTHGGNGRDAYADIESANVGAAVGPRALIQETWNRYHLPIAVTEVHNSGSREEQLRWLHEVWQAADASRREGVDLVAVTAWSLLGTFHWNRLVTCCDGVYESGVFDVRAPRPRRTAIATMVQGLASGKPFHHPVLQTPGWWGRPERWLYPSALRSPETYEPPRLATFHNSAVRPIIITGASGTLGRAFARICEVRGLSYRLLGRQDFDIADPVSVNAGMDAYNPWAIINAAGYVRVDEAESDTDRCFRENMLGPVELATACAKRGTALVTFSSDLVFDGQSARPYVETASVHPLSVYGRSKATAEARVLTLCPSALVVRTSAFFGPWDHHNFITYALRTLAAGQEFVAADDTIVSPTYVPDLVHSCLDLLIDGETGIWHLANDAEITWAEFARRAADATGLGVRHVRGVSTASLDLAAERPAYSVLGSERGWLMSSVDDALARYVADCPEGWFDPRHLTGGV